MNYGDRTSFKAIKTILIFVVFSAISCTFLNDKIVAIMKSSAQSKMILQQQVNAYNQMQANENPQNGAPVENNDINIENVTFPSGDIHISPELLEQAKAIQQQQQQQQQENQAKVEQAIMNAREQIQQDSQEKQELQRQLEEQRIQLEQQRQQLEEQKRQLEQNNYRVQENINPNQMEPIEPPMVQ